LAGAVVLATHAGVGFGFFGMYISRPYDVGKAGCCGQKIHASSHNSLKEDRVCSTFLP
jgi:hypothetical protein